MRKILNPYIRRANYYETDQMGVIHHSNYIRWFEEARIDYMNQLGFSLAESERCGITTPVVGVECSYKSSVRFDEEVSIFVKMVHFNGVRGTMAYEIRDMEGRLRACGETRHCFLNAAGNPVSLKKALPELYEVFLAHLEEK